MSMKDSTLIIIAGVAVGGYIIWRKNGGSIGAGPISSIAGVPPGNQGPAGTLGNQGGALAGATATSGGAGSSQAAAAAGLISALGGLLSGFGPAVKGIPSWGAGGGDTVQPLSGDPASDAGGISYAGASAGVDDPNAFQLGDPDLSAGQSYTNSISLGGDPTNSTGDGDPLGLGSLSLGSF